MCNNQRGAKVDFRQRTAHRRGEARGHVLREVGQR